MSGTSNVETRKYLEAIGKNYNSITNKRNFQHYLERRKKYIRICCENNPKENAMIVDLAAGTGNYSEVFSNYSRLLNMDISLNALKASKVLNDKISRINADALNAPLKDDLADIILLIGILHHIPHRLEELFKEILRVLKKGGVVIIDEPNGYNILWFLYMKLCQIDKFGTRPLFPYMLKKIAEKHNLYVEKELFWGFVPPWPDKKIIVDFFGKLESIIEGSFLSYFCTRYLLVLRKRSKF